MAEKNRDYLLMQERKELAELKAQKRYIVICAKNEAIRKYAKINNFDVIEVFSDHQESAARYIICLNDKTQNAIGNKIKDIVIPGLKEKIQSFYSHIKELSIAEAMEYIVFANGGLTKCLKKPETAAITGFLCGYNSCCVEYYLMTRFYGFQKNKKEAQDALVTGRIRCVN